MAADKIIFDAKFSHHMLPCCFTANEIGQPSQDSGYPPGLICLSNKG